MRRITLNIATVNDNTRKRLSDSLTKLQGIIEKEAIQSEADLEKFFQVQSKAQLDIWEGLGFVKKPENETLLEILGYEYGDVEDHPSKKVNIGASRYSPDYILKRGGKPLAIVDLKTPDANLDLGKWAGQIGYYCHMENVPIGFLFNGRSLRVFVNVGLKGLTRYAVHLKEPSPAGAGTDNLKQMSVAEADTDNLRQMVDLLLKFAAAHPEGNPVAVARELVSQRLKELKDKERKRDIGNRLKELLANPPDEMLKALPDLSIWGTITRKPSVNELLKIRNDLVQTAKYPKPLPNLRGTGSKNG